MTITLECTEEQRPQYEEMDRQCRKADPLLRDEGWRHFVISESSVEDIAFGVPHRMSWKTPAWKRGIFDNGEWVANQELRAVFHFGRWEALHEGTDGKYEQECDKFEAAYDMAEHWRGQYEGGEYKEQ